MYPMNCSGPMRRRDALRVGALALGGLSLPRVLAGQSTSGEAGRDAAVILLWLHGGPSHLETYDLKPHAPIEYRSLFAPIPTRIPGMEICELLPQHAGLSDKLAIIRTLHHDIGTHNDAGITVLTGKKPARLDPTDASLSQHPDIGSVTSKMLGLHCSGLPRYAAVPRKLHMTRPAYGGVQHGPFILGDPNEPDFQPPSLSLSASMSGPKLEDRRTLVRHLDLLRSDLDLRQALTGTNEFRERAFSMLSSRSVAEAFKISREKDALRERYGRNVWGQSCLLARRLAEAGTSLVTVFLDIPKSGEEFTGWDDHAGNNGRLGHFGKYLRVRLPYYDQAVSALIEDVYARGLDRKILIIAMGEFGRTPLIHYSPGVKTYGRDHWPHAFSALVSGGGLRMGQVIGATNSKGEYPTQRPCSPQDLLATAYRHLGIDCRRALYDHSGRPVPILSDGVPIGELV